MPDARVATEEGPGKVGGSGVLVTIYDSGPNEAVAPESLAVSSEA